MATDNAEKRRSVPRMLGDFLREAAVLVIVFYPLDRYFNYQHPERVVDTVAVQEIVELSLGLLVAGMALEKIDFGAIAVRCLNIAVVALTRVKKMVEGGEE